ncbi:MAG: cobalamin-binding protein [Chlamydiales bacterium]
MMTEIKIISLIPSGTEIVCSLGFKGNIVGRSHECDFPHDIQKIPICTKSHIDSSADSKQIDEQVRYRLINYLSIYELDINLISQLNPNIIITQSQCNICAIGSEEVEDNLAFKMSFNEKLKLVNLVANDLETIFDDIQRIADALEVSSKGFSLIKHMKNEIFNLNSKIHPLFNKPRIACIEWIDPLMVAGNWVPALVELAGGENLFSIKGHPSPWLKAEKLISADPDIIIVMACGFDIKRTIKEMNTFFKIKEFKNLNAIRNKRLFVTDANHFFIRPGPRIIDSLKILCEIIHPEKFQPTYKGLGWENYAADIVT